MTRRASAPDSTVSERPETGAATAKVAAQIGIFAAIRKGVPSTLRTTDDALGCPALGCAGGVGGLEQAPSIAASKMIHRLLGMIPLLLLPSRSFNFVALIFPDFAPARETIECC
jgi:hypothetical protein